MKVPSAGLFASLSVVVALAAIIAGLAVIGSPDAIRLRRSDLRRTADFDSIVRAIQAYRLTHENLPRTLDELSSVSLRDPLGRPYEYSVKDAYSYELCTEFDTVQDGPGNTSAPSYKFEKHGSGRQCFSLEARPRAQR